MGFLFFFSPKGLKNLGRTGIKYSFLAAYLDASCPVSNLFTDRNVRPGRTSQPSCQKWRQSGLSPQRSMSTLKSKGGYIAEEEKLGHSTSISLLGCHLSDSVGRYWCDFFFSPPLSTGTKSLLDAEGREERGSENNL